MPVSLMTVGFVALMLLSACTGGTSSAAYTSNNYDQAQAACNAGNGAACVTVNNLRTEGWRF